PGPRDMRAPPPAPTNAEPDGPARDAAAEAGAGSRRDGPGRDGAAEDMSLKTSSEPRAPAASPVPEDILPPTTKHPGPAASPVPEDILSATTKHPGPARDDAPQGASPPAERDNAARGRAAGDDASLLPPGLSPRLALIGVLALVGLVHLPLLGFQFVYDDGWTIAANGFLRSPGDLPLLFTPEAVARHVPDAFRPGLVAFDVLTYQLFGLSSPLHHLLSIALHVGVCAVLARWLRLLGAPLDLVLAAVTLFGLLAVHAEAVAVVSYREDLLAALLGLGACIAATRGRLASAALLSLGACSMKLSAAAIPALWLLAAGLSPWRPRPRAKTLIAGTLALALGVAAFVAFTVSIYGRIDPYGAGNLRVYSERVGLAPVLAASLPIHLGYLQQMVLPFGLSPEYTDHARSFTDPATILAGAALLALFAYGLANVRRRPLAALSILGAFALAVPTSNLFPMPNMRADRFTYLPSVPACLGLAALLLAAGRWLSRHVPADSKPLALLAPLVAAVVLQGSVRVAAASVYRDNSHLWAAARARAPDSARAHAVWGELVLRNLSPELPPDERSVALAHLEALCKNAERHDPTYELPQLCFARLAAAREDWAEAYRRYRLALSYSPDRNARIYAGLAEVSLDLPHTPTAVRHRLARRHLEEGLSQYPYSPELHATAGRIFHRLGEPELAARHYETSLALAPERPDALLGHLELLLDLGRPADATRLLLAEKTAWLAADPSVRNALIARHRDALRLFDPSMILSADPVGVFAHEP
ncbi:MAG TPA: hypothetical protein VIK91_20630, partial [Nannocystis sp.]